eukprot:8171578-Heterocapsa_arctica.AAC.1
MRYHVGADGMSAAERRNGRPRRRTMVEFKERGQFGSVGSSTRRSTTRLQMIEDYYLGHHATM